LVVRHLREFVLHLGGERASRYHVLALPPRLLGVLVRGGGVLHGEHPDAVDVPAGGAAEEAVVAVGVEEVAREVVAVVLVATAVGVETAGGHGVRLAGVELCVQVRVELTPSSPAHVLQGLAPGVVRVHGLPVREVIPGLGRVLDAEKPPHDFSPHALRSRLATHLTRDAHHPHDVRRM
jgi:hypothetical protein